MVDGDPIYWANLQPWLAEVAGGPTLQEYVVDRRLERELSGRGIVVTDEAVRRERDLLARTMQQGVGELAPAGGTPDDVARVIADLRQARGLGDVRFAALLRRSAGLRLLIQDRVQVSEESVQQAFAIKYGEKRKIRFLLVPSQKQAAEVLGKLSGEGTPADLSERFARAARESSIDPSAARGGEIEPFSCEDPAYPSVLRQAAGSMGVGGLSAVLAMDRGYAIAMVESIIPGRPPGSAPSDAEREQLRADVRLRIERLQMDRAAAELVNRPGVSVLDRSLDWSWRNAAKQRP